MHRYDLFRYIFKFNEVRLRKNFADYIEFLKMARNARTHNLDLVKMLDETLFTFIDKPKLFSVNLDELIEVDALLQDLYVVDDQEGFVGHAVLSNEEYGSESILV